MPQGRATKSEIVNVTAMAKRKQGPGTPVGEGSPLGRAARKPRSTPTPPKTVIKRQWPGARTRSEAEDANALWVLSLDAGVGVGLARKNGLPGDRIAQALVRIARVRREPDLFKRRGDTAFLLRFVASAEFAARRNPTRRSAGAPQGRAAKP